ncbi:hypothetical protein F7725_020219 [Dissostichus mawsoni]|uniref:Alpha-2-macroglobulin n=1 Tax=Dissostichus mawsoni TaxID=36200 RepID=A0A7J5YDY2_DISMA|nr:hypothetical protein F7725_020219 [Dissostichus mawsoni]
MKMATNLVIRVPTCLKYRGREYHQGHGFGISRLLYDSPVVASMERQFDSAPGASYSPDDSPIETVRTFFPETWIWDLLEVGKSGTKDVSVTVPDTITTWETEAFCLSSQGFGLAPRKEITVFQPFFLELSLPYSIIRGEHFELKATIFNYLTSCIMVTVAPTPSLDYTLTPLSGDQYTSCLCGGERKTLSWTMAPSALGVMNVSVTAEAVASQVSCDNEIVSVPERGRIDVVKRSLIVKAEGTEMSKTYNWLLCPKGEALKEEIEIQLPENVILGSARASLSVLAQSFLYIDPTKIEESKIWLQWKQRENGCFEQSGKLFNNRMKGGVSDEVTLSAYITAAFLEMKTSVEDPVVNKSLSCLKESISDLSNTYTTALMAYVFTLAGDMETRAHLLNHLDTVGIQNGGFLHWSQTASEKSASLSVEISSYVLLAKLSASPTTEDLGYAAGIVRWLAGQQNNYGGFSSTQDTVVALQALAFYSALVFSPGGSSSVTVQSPSDTLTFDVNQNNKLLYQEKLLQDVTGKFSLEVKGTACAAMQISQHYNIPTPTDATTLSVNVRTDIDCASKNTKLTLNLQSRFSGKENSTNMVILDIKALSGFVPDQVSLKRLKGAMLVDRVEQKEDHVLVYIRELPKDIPINHSLDLRLEIPVQNMKPAVVKIYDYYQPSDQAETEYTHPCVSVSHGSSRDSDVGADTVCLLELDVCGSSSGRTYMVAIPAVLEAGAETKFCASLLQPNETLVMTVTLMSEETNTTLIQQTSSEDFHICTQFKWKMKWCSRWKYEDTFYSKEVRKVMIRSYQPMTFIQTDKPIYLPGQTGNDANRNRIGQWLNETSDSILQLSYALNSEAREGSYKVSVSTGSNKVYHSFKVEKYVSIDQEEIKAEVCVTYTYGQPVPGSVNVEMCRPFKHFVIFTLDNPEGIYAPCYKETKQTDKKGCATFIFTMSTFTKVAQKVLLDKLKLTAEMEEEGTGKYFYIYLYFASQYISIHYIYIYIYFKR